MPDPSIDQRISGGVSDLLVLWQHPATREIVPIGRLWREYDEYCFAYTRGAEQVEAFRPLPGLPRLDIVYRSRRMPSVFGQRVMGPDRPDYRRYMDSLGLPQSGTSPWEQIVRSGGLREGDTLQFMEVPTVRGGRACATFLANGVRHIPGSSLAFRGGVVTTTPEEHESALAQLTSGSSVDVISEEGNSHDQHACLLVVGRTPLGWVPRTLAPSVRELLEVEEVTATVVRIGAADGSPHLRLVLSMNVDAPPGFEFDRAGRWQPITRS